MRPRPISARPGARPHIALAPRVAGRARLALAAALALALGGCAAPEGVIRGQVTLAPVPRTGAPVPAGLEHDPRAAVVYLATAPPTGARPTPSGVRVAIIDQTGQGFRPSVVAVPAGSIVQFRNRDQVFHGAFTASGPDSFDIGRYGPGATREVLLPTEGRLTVFCELHPSEIAFIAVVPGAVIARPDATGAYRLPALPLGRYELRVWHPAYGEIRRTVELRDRHGARVPLQF